MKKEKRKFTAHVDGYFSSENGHQHFHFDPIEVEIWQHWSINEKRDAVVFALLDRIDPEAFKY